jgi:hypothetical protein
VGDVLLRRTRLGLIAARELVGDVECAPGGDRSLPSDRGRAADRDPTADVAPVMDRVPVVGRVAELLAGELGWSERRTGTESSAFMVEARLEGILVGA